MLDLDKPLVTTDGHDVHLVARDYQPLPGMEPRIAVRILRDRWSELCYLDPDGMPFYPLSPWRVINKPETKRTFRVIYPSGTVGSIHNTLEEARARGSSCALAIIEIIIEGEEVSVVTHKI